MKNVQTKQEKMIIFENESDRSSIFYFWSISEENNDMIKIIIQVYGFLSWCLNLSIKGKLLIMGNSKKS